MNFGFGVGFGLAWLSVLWGQDRISFPRWVVAAGLGVATVVSHGFVFLASLFLIFAGLLTEGKYLSRRALISMLSALPGTAIFVLFILNIRESSQLGANKFIYAANLEHLFVWNPLGIWAGVSGSLDEMLAVIAWALLFAACVLTGRRALQLRRAGRDSLMVTVWGLVLGSICLYLLLPGRLSGGWGLMKVRICLILFFVSLPLLSFLTVRLRGIAAVVAFGVWALGLGLSFVDYRDFSHNVSAYMEVADKLPREAVVLSLNLMAPGRTLNPYQHIWGYASSGRTVFLRNCLLTSTYNKSTLTGPCWEERKLFPRMNRLPSPRLWKAVNTMRY